MGDLVVKTNRLNSAIQNLSLAEIHIIQLGIVDARETGNGFSPDKPLRIDALRYAEVFGTTRQNAYKRLKEVEDTLFNRRFSFVDAEGKIIKSRWIQDVRYLNEEGAIEIAFTRTVVEGISRIDGAENFFTSYLLEQTSSMSSNYSVRLYELLIQWKNIVKTPLFLLDGFKGQLGLEDNEYKAMCDFKKRVLDVAVKEINDKSDIVVGYKQKKEGRKIIGFNFTVKSKEADKKKEVVRNKNMVDHVKNQADNEKKQTWRTKGLSEAQILRLSNKKRADKLIGANIKSVENLGIHTSGSSTHDIFKKLEIFLDDPSKLYAFKNIQECLDLEV